MVVCTNRALKMKERLPFCSELIVLCVEGRVVVERVV